MIKDNGTKPENRTTVHTSLRLQPATRERWDEVVKRYGTTREDVLLRALDALEADDMTVDQVVDWIRRHGSAAG